METFGTIVAYVGGFFFVPLASLVRGYYGKRYGIDGTIGLVSPSTQIIQLQEPRYRKRVIGRGYVCDIEVYS